MKQRFAAPLTVPAAPTSIIAFGTVGVRQLIRYLKLKKNAGQQDTVGALLLGDLDERTIAEFYKEAPEIFQGRVVIFAHAAFANGFGRRTPDEVTDAAVRGLWLSNLLKALDQWALRHQRCQGHSTLPATILVFGSLGSHATPMLEGLRWLRDKYPTATMTLCLSIPDDQNRVWSRMLIEQARATGVDTILLQDDAVDAAGGDVNLAYGLVGIDAGIAMTNLAPVAGNNMAASLCPPTQRQQGQLVIRMYHRDLIAAGQIFTHRRLGARFSAREDGLQAVILGGLSRIRQHAKHSSVGFIPDEGAHPNATSLLIVAGNADPESWQSVAREVRTSLIATGEKSPRREVIFLSTREPFPALTDEATCQLHLVLIEPVANPTAFLDRIFRDPVAEVRSPGQASQATLSWIPTPGGPAQPVGVAGDSPAAPVFQIATTSVVTSNGRQQ